MAESDPTYYYILPAASEFTEELATRVNFMDECIWKAFVFPEGEEEYWDDIDHLL